MKHQPDLFKVQKSVSPLTEKINEFIKENKIQTFYTKMSDQDDMPYLAWSGEPEFKGLDDFLNTYGQDAFGYGRTKKEAIYEFAKLHKYEGWEKLDWSGS